MNIIIIEDEENSAEDLRQNILKHIPNANIIALLKSVKETITYLKEHEQPDLFISDIELGDGLSFEIFKTVKTTSPVIFVTAYNEYALDAFKANGIDYILKPFDHKTVSMALDKYSTLTGAKLKSPDFDVLLQWMGNTPKENKSSILVYQKDKIIPVKLSEIALFYIENEFVRVHCINGIQYTTNQTLDELEKICGNAFIRANRQYILNRSIIKEASFYFNRKLLVNLTIHFKDQILISKEKSTTFLEWLASN
jgi:two-component system, LytTR family, response regulator LytT